MTEAGTPQPITADQLDIKPVANKVAVETLTATPKGEAKKTAEAVRSLSIGTVDAVGGREIPDGMRDNLFIGLFGTKDVAAITDPQLKPLAQGLDKIMSTLKDNLDPGVATPTELNQAIQSVIEQTPGWSDAFKKMSATQQAEVIKSIREMGAASFGRRMMIEKITISQESGNYGAAKRKFEDASNQLNARRLEKVTVDTQIGAIGGDRAKVTADKQSKDREATSLLRERDRLQEQKSRIDRQIAEREQSYIDTGKSGKDLTDALNADSRYQKMLKDLDAIDDKISDPVSGIDKKIGDAEAELQVLEKNLQYFERADSLTTQVEDLTNKVSSAEAEMINARTALANSLNDLMKNLNGVMPEAAKEAMNKYKIRLDEANQQKAVDEANKKAEDAKKEGDMLALAEAEITKAFELRYVKTEDQRRLRTLFMAKEQVQVIDESALRADFQDMLNPATGTRGVMERIIKGSATGLAGPEAGLSQQTIDYLNSHPDAAAKLVEKMRIPIFKSVARKAVLHLDLNETSLRSLATSPDFVEAAKAAIADNADIEKVIDSVYGAKLGGSRNVAEAFKKLPAGGLLGVLMLIFGLIGSGLFTQKP